MGYFLIVILKKIIKDATDASFYQKKTNIFLRQAISTFICILIACLFISTDSYTAMMRSLVFIAIEFSFFSYVIFQAMKFDHNFRKNNFN